MFEESLVVSQVVPISATRRWTVAGSTALQAAVAAVLIVIPLLHPERLTFHTSTPLVFAPPPPKPPLPPTQPEHTAQGATSLAPSIATGTHMLILTRGPRPAIDQPPIIGPISMNPSVGIPDLLAREDGHGVKVSATEPTTTAKSPIPVSKGVLAGLLLSPIRPIYPVIAKAAGISGTVVVEAIISKTGAIESLHIVSGPEMLRSAALDAIRAARYQPFRLNGEPIDIQTTITVNFRLGA
jgi:protein TonB